MSRKDGAIEPTIKAIETMSVLREWASLQDDANVPRVPLAQRISGYGKNSWAGFDMGDWQYDPWFTEWSQGGHGQSDDSGDPDRTAANVYNFSFWQYLDISYYFGHQLLTIPPTVWTNAAHKNGVKSLGTLNLNYSEKVTPEDVANFLSHEPPNPPQPKPIYIDEAETILRGIAGYYGFEGYLFNYESFDPAHDLNEGMKELMSRLRAAKLTVVWYDSPLSGGYSNELTESAYPFFQAAGYFQSNYGWGPFGGPADCPKESYQVLANHKDDEDPLTARNRVCMMMDCGTDRDTPPYGSPLNPTCNFFPALAQIDVAAPPPPDYYTAIGYYGPDWVMYHGIAKKEAKLPSRDIFHYNDRAFWAGTTKFFIDWPNRGDNPVKPEQCIAHYVTERSVITSTPFVTWFNGGEGDFYNINGETKSRGPWNNLSDQSLLPTWCFKGVCRKGDTTIDNTTIDYSDAFTGGSSLRISFKGFDPAYPITVWGFKTKIELKATSTYIVSVTVKGQGVDVAPVLGDFDLSNPQVVQFKNGWQQMTYAVPESMAGQTIPGIHIRVKQSPPEGEIRLGELRFLDTAKPPKKPWIKAFQPTDVLDWSDSFDWSSHYRVYGILNQQNYLVGVVYNCVYVTVSNVFNSELKGFTGYIVQEVNAAGGSTPI
jgi:endo-beta-N-acetylglucosaminidase D